VARPADTAGLDGVLVLAKPPGPTSHDVVALARRLTGTRRIGHGGTLDPFAAGVLPLFLGGATRLVEYHLGDRKGYRATICFGASSTTDDLDGELSPVAGPVLASAAVEAALVTFRGELRQRPPDYSAIKVGGRRAYALARKGTPAELADRTVIIHELELVAWNSDDPARPIAIVDVTCSAGTYVRAIARDLGAALGSAAYLGALVRTASGPFRLEDAVSLDALRTAATEGAAAIEALLLPVDAGLEAMPSVRLAPEEIADAAMGRFVRPSAGLSNLPSDVPIRLLDSEGRIVGIGAVDGRRIAPAKILPGAVAAVAGAARPQPTGPEDGVENASEQPAETVEHADA
jgi:tRNA pseudouridine55 synthase